MNKPYYNDQAHIAYEYYLHEEHLKETARLAFFKINSYKLSLIKAAFCNTKEELTTIIKGSLLNYTDTGNILSRSGFFDTNIYN